MQVLVPQLKSTTVEFGGEQTLMRTYSVIIWDPALKARPVLDLVIKDALVSL